MKLLYSLHLLRSHPDASTMQEVKNLVHYDSKSLQKVSRLETYLQQRKLIREMVKKKNRGAEYETINQIEGGGPVGAPCRKPPYTV